MNLLDYTMLLVVVQRGIIYSPIRASLVGVIAENLDKHIESAECNLNYRFCY